MHSPQKHLLLPRGNRLVLILAVAFALAACGQPATSAPTPTQPTGGVLTAVLAASELTVGANRLPLGIVKNGTPVNNPDLKVHLRVFSLEGDDQQAVRGEADAAYRGQGLPFGLYVAYPSFDAPGAWGLEIQMTEPGAQPQTNRLRVEVVPQATTPAVGSKAFPSKNLTAKDVPDLKQLTSDSRPDPDLYQLTIADALVAKQPFLLAFSTPGFCETAVCAPNLEVIKQLKESFKGQVNFLHVEVYPYPFTDSVREQRLVPAMAEWKLASEPWTFLVDGQGVIQAKYEGGITFAELEPALTQLAAGQPVMPPTP
jgi:hypothetical protein